MKKKLLSKIVCSTLALALVLGMTACGNTAGNNVSKETASESSSAVTSSETSTSSEVKEVEREHVTLSLYNYFNANQPGFEETWAAVNEYLEEKLNTTLEIHMYDTLTEYVNAVPTILSSGGDIDILYTGAGRVDFATFAGQNAYVALEDYVDEYLTGTKELVSDAVWEAYTVNGHIYAVPLPRDYAQRFNFLINQTMLDDLGLTLPEKYRTLWDVMDFLYEVKEARDAKYPNKAKQPIIKDVRGLEGYYPSEAIVTKDKMVVANIPGIESYAGMGSGETVFCSYFTDEYRNYAKTIRQLVEDGIMPSDVANFDTDKVIDRAGELIGSYSAGHIYVDEDLNAPYYKTTLYAAEISNVQTATLQAGGYAIPANSDNVERALEVIDLINSDPYLATVFRFGPEGIGWTDEDNNNIIELTQLNADASNRYMYYWYGWNLGGLLATKVAEGYPENFSDLLYSFNNDATAAGNVGFILNASPIENEIAACSNVIAEYDGILKNGQTADVDKTVDEFIAKLKANGMEKIVEEAQNQVTAWRSAKGLSTK